MTLAAFCVGNVVGTETFLPKDAPDYLPGKISILVLLSTQFFVCLIMRLINQHMNRQKTKIIEGLKVENGWSDEDVERERQKHAFLDLTDKEYVCGQSSRCWLLTVRQEPVLRVHKLSGGNYKAYLLRRTGSRMCA